MGGLVWKVFIGLF